MPNAQDEWVLTRVGVCYLDRYKLEPIFGI